ncbi:MAG: S9 family peptidase, partial [Flavobacteriaceae bacterium]
MKNLLYVFFILSSMSVYAQGNLTYQKPPREILELVDVSRAPNVLMDEEQENMILLYRDSYKSIEELSQEELRLAGLRIDPNTNIGSRVTYFNNVKIKHLNKKGAEIIQVKGLPQKPKLTNFSWSPDQSKIALTNTNKNGVEVWVLDIKSAAVTQLTKARINGN